ncbi:hypothetical protein BKA93DRAFT_792028 [Sparassis latifolia]
MRSQSAVSFEVAALLCLFPVLPVYCSGICTVALYPAAAVIPDSRTAGARLATILMRSPVSMLTGTAGRESALDVLQ